MKSIWIPPQQEQLRRYLRWSTISSFVIVMLGLVSVFVDEFSQSRDFQRRAQQEIAVAEQAARQRSDTTGRGSPTFPA